MQLIRYKQIIKTGVYGTALSLTTMYAQASVVDFSALVEKISPAVVSVNVIKKENNPYTEQVPEVLRRFFGDQFTVPEQQESGYGSAFFISQDGYLLTNHHVVDGATHISIVLNDRQELDAKLIGSDKRTDIALLKVEGTHYPSLNIGRVDTLKVGEPVLAIGSPFGFDYSASAGIVSAKSRSMSHEASVPFIQSDVALNPGNSGGPLFNQKGEVVGVNSRIFSGTGGYMGLSFSVPIDVAMDVAQQLKTTGRVARGYLGINLQDMDQELAQTYAFNKPQGSLITNVEPQSPASQAGLSIGDVILKFNGQPISRTSDLMDYLYRASPNQQVKLEILRQGKLQVIPVQLGVAPDTTNTKKEQPSIQQNQKDKQVLGMILRTLTAQERQRIGLKQGIVIYDLANYGLASRAGLMPNDVITHVNDHTIASVEEFVNQIDRYKQQNLVRVTIWRQGQRAILPLRLK